MTFFNINTFFKYHLSDLYYHLIIMILTFLFCFFVNFIFIDQIIFLLIKSFLINQINYFIITDLTEFFYIKCKITFLCTIIYIIPFFFLTILIFLIPGLYYTELKKSITVILIIIIFYFSLIYITLTIFVPLSCSFFQKFQNISYSFLYNFYLEPKLQNYLDFVINIMFYSLIMSQYIIILFNLIYNKIINLTHLIKYRKIFYLQFIIIATIGSPPDVLNQILILIPLIIFFELILFVFILNKNYYK